MLPEPAGIRAQVLTKAGGLVDDFRYSRTERMLHMINAPSPAATAALPIGEHIATLCLDSAA
jgi:L-2-hydroxyglutarate oxidase